MDAKRWQQIKAVLGQVSEQPPEAWSAFLDEACDGDDELHQEVRSLLAYHDEDMGIVDQPVFDINTTDPRIDTRIGHYRIVRRIGRGGMGVVYLATREEDFSQRVAIKLIQRGLDSTERVARFHAERQILADLDHPAIARLFDGGTTDDGLPYLVMELVDGEPIDVYCDRQRLSVRDRIMLFRQVLDAVQTSHSLLVVHRDLKPSNILVTDDGYLKLIDFGIAKLLQPEPEVGPSASRNGHRPMSPSYASPEQARGERTSTASDLYTLGLVFCELLSGSKPYEVEATDPETLAREICESVPRTPSRIVDENADAEQLAETRRTSVAKLRRQLAGELDAIVLKALHKEPGARYRSAEDFSDDLDRYLADLPVRAVKDSMRYRTGKFIRRHPMLLLATVLALATIVGLLSSFVLRSRLLDQRTRAEAVEDFVGTLFRAADPDRAEGEELTVRELLDRGGEDLESGLDAQPLVRAALMAVVGRVYENLGDLDQAESRLREALSLQRRFDPEDDALLARRANDLAAVLRRRNEFEAAESYYREALERIGGCRSRHPDAIYITGNLAFLLSDLGQLDEAESLLDCLLGHRIERSWDLRTAAVLNKLATLRYHQSRLDEAEALFREVLVIRLGVHGRDHTRFAATLNNLGKVYYDQGKYRKAEKPLRLAFDIRRLLLGTDHEKTKNTEKHLAAVLAALAADDGVKASAAILGTAEPGPIDREPPRR